MKRKFACVARDETYAWSDLPAQCGIVFGLYIFCVGEATHVCSMTPSSYVQFLENVFGGIPGDHPYADDHAYDNGGETGTYITFITDEHRAKHPTLYTDPIEFEVDDEANEDDTRQALWDAAMEYFRGNTPSPAILTGIAP
jgi:hypothetical protein